MMVNDPIVAPSAIDANSMTATMLITVRLGFASRDKEADEKQ